MLFWISVIEKLSFSNNSVKSLQCICSNIIAFHIKDDKDIDTLEISDVCKHIIYHSYNKIPSYILCLRPMLNVKKISHLFYDV